MANEMVTLATSGGAVRLPRALLTTLVENAEAGYRKMAWGGVELGGILLGKRGEGPEAAVTITEAPGSACEHEFGPSFHLSARDVEGLATQLAEVGAGKVVGYWLTSSRDLSLTAETAAILDRYFFQPWQVVLVLLRGRNVPTKVCVYRGGPGKRVGSAGMLVEEVLAAAEGEEELGNLAVAAATNAPVAETTPAAAAEAGPVSEAGATWGSLAGQGTRPPSNASFYASVQHREAVAVLERGIRARRGVMLLVGEAGTGKTAVLEALRDRLAESHAELSVLRNPRLSVDELFEHLAYDLHLQATNTRKVAVLFALQQRAARLAEAGQTLAVLFDDAHLLDRELLLEIELLENIETRWGKLLQVVLSGRPELHKRLGESEHLGLRQRVSLQARVGPFDAAETRSYALHRFVLDGLQADQLWEPGFDAELFRLSQGLPRLINTLCDHVAEEAGRRGESRWTPALLREIAG
ncbi:MAG: AAA family ATPase [Bryobacterales bacterium]|nr:AAA family ATPase [Bryobacterales bacterium]